MHLFLACLSARTPQTHHALSLVPHTHAAAWLCTTATLSQQMTNQLQGERDFVTRHAHSNGELLQRSLREATLPGSVLPFLGRSSAEAQTKLREAERHATHTNSTL